MTEPDEAISKPVPRSDPPPQHWATIGIFLLFLIAGMAYARAFLMPVVLALLLSIVFSSPRRMLERLGLNTGFAALLIVTLLIVAMVSGTARLAAPVSDWVARAPAIAQELELKLRDIRGLAEGMREAAGQIEKLADTEDEPGVQRVVVQGDQTVSSLVFTIPAVTAQIIFTLVLLFFLLASGDMFYEKIVHVAPTFGDKKRAMRIAFDIERKLSRYLMTIVVINAGLGVAIAVTMWLLGMPNPVMFGVLGFFLNFIPYLGAILGVVLATVVGIVSLEPLQQGLLVGVSYLALTAIEGQLVTPYFVGRSLRLNTVVVFLFITLFAWLWSVVGMLVATPLLVTIKTFCEHIPRLEPYGDFLSARGAERDMGEEEKVRS